MKKCMICGGIGDENSTICKLCGIPYEDVAEDTSETESFDKEADGTDSPKTEPSMADIDEQEAVSQGKAAAEPQGTPAEGKQQVRRMRSAPQIYGQMKPMPSQEQQGMVRKNIQGRPAGGPQRAMDYQRQVSQGRPMNGRPPRPMNPAPNMGRRPMMQGPGQKARQVSQTSRKMLHSPLFLLIALFHTVYLAGSIAAVFMSQLNFSQLARIIQRLDLPLQVSGYVDSTVTILSKLDSGMVVQNLVIHIPDLLFCIGLWLVYITAATARDRMSGIGFGFIKADIIINMIASCLLMLVVLVVVVATVVASWISQNRVMLIMTGIFLILTIVVVMMVIMYYFSYLATIKTCRVNSNAGESYGRVSFYVAVIHIILALFAVVSLLSGIVNSEIAGIASAVGKIVWMVLFSVWLIKYRNKLEEIEE